MIFTNSKNKIGLKDITLDIEFVLNRLNYVLSLVNNHIIKSRGNRNRNI